MSQLTPAKDLSATLGAMELPDADGKPVQLGALWKERPLLLVHLRHFG